MDDMALTSEGKAVGGAGLAGVGIRRLVLDTGAFSTSAGELGGDGELVSMGTRREVRTGDIILSLGKWILGVVYVQRPFPRHGRLMRVKKSKAIWEQ